MSEYTAEDFANARFAEDKGGVVMAARDHIGVRVTAAPGIEGDE